MIQCEHFIYALFNDAGYRLIKSRNAENLLSEKNFQGLCHLGDNTTRKMVLPQWFRTEQVLSVSLIAPLQDEFGRTGSWNHTILIPFKDYCALTDVAEVFKPYFMEPTAKPPKTLKPLKVEKK